MQNKLENINSEEEKELYHMIKTNKNKMKIINECIIINIMIIME